MASPPYQYPQFILIGDSIVQYSNNLTNGGYAFGAGLEQHCSRRLDVINRGLSGYNTDNILRILPLLIPPPSSAKVEYILILFGANDSCLPASPTKQHVPLSKYRSNLISILTHPSLTTHNPTILLVTPPPINEAHLEAEDLKKNRGLSREQAVSARYADAARSVAREFQDRNVVLVDLWNAMMGEAEARTPGGVPVPVGKLLGSREEGDSQALRELLVDGLHLTRDGYEVFLREVVKHVGKAWKDEPEEEPSWIFPHWTVAPKIP